MMARLLIVLVQIYRATLSVWLGGRCRFYPSCSQYALDALTQHGAWHGSALSARRLVRCHPWHLGGVDPVPPRVDARTQLVGVQTRQGTAVPAARG